jgi:hypothetical protein|mmetsp:Transcript_25147/g.39731  ORF Transcript_25147/g.39731 Transcript_25147/m.39731 type:complete len:242 (+) Transcript_25147:769-1494(+)
MVEAAEMWEVDWGSAAEAAEAAAGQAQATLGQAVVQIVEDEMVGAPLLLACRAGACQHIAVPGAHADVGMHTVVGNGVDVGMHTVVGTDVEGVVRAEVGLHGEVGLRVEVGLHVEVGLLERFLAHRYRRSGWWVVGCHPSELGWNANTHCQCRTRAGNHRSPPANHWPLNHIPKTECCGCGTGDVRGSVRPPSANATADGNPPCLGTLLQTPPAHSWRRGPGRPASQRNNRDSRSTQPFVH